MQGMPTPCPCMLSSQVCAIESKKPNAGYPKCLKRDDSPRYDQSSLIKKSVQYMNTSQHHNHAMKPKENPKLLPTKSESITRSLPTPQASILTLLIFSSLLCFASFFSQSNRFFSFTALS